MKYKTLYTYLVISIRIDTRALRFYTQDTRLTNFVFEKNGILSFYLSIKTLIIAKLKNNLRKVVDKHINYTCFTLAF